MSDRFTLTVGKQDIALGGYEYYVNAIKVREYSEFNDNISCYQAGVAGRFNLSSTNELVLQVVNNLVEKMMNLSLRFATRSGKS